MRETNAENQKDTEQQAQKGDSTALRTRIASRRYRFLHRIHVHVAGSLSHAQDHMLAEIPVNGKANVAHMTSFIRGGMPV